MVDTAQQASVIRAGLDPSNFEQGAQRLSAAAQRAAAGMEGLGASGEKVQRSVGDAGAKFDRLVRSLDDGAKSAAGFARDYTTIVRGVANSRDLDQAASAVDALAKRWFGVGEAAEAAAAKAKAALAQAGTTGFDPRATAAEVSALANTTRAQEEKERSLDRLRRQYVPLAAAQAEYQRQLREIATLERNGKLSADELAEARERARKQAAQQGVPEAQTPGRQGGLADYQKQNAAAQITDLAVQIGTGGLAALPTALLQQIPQLVASVGGLGRAFSLLATPLSTAAAAGVAFIGTSVGLIGAVNSQSAAVTESETSLRNYRNDYQQVAVAVAAAARQVAVSSSLSNQEALEVLRTISRSPMVSASQENLVRLAKLSADVAAQFRLSNQEAAGFVRQVFQDPAKAAETLAQVMSDRVSPEFVELIRRMQSSGDQASATRAVLDKLTEGVRGASDPMTRLGEAFRKLINEVSALKDALATHGNTWGGLANEAAISTINGIKDAITGLKAVLTADFAMPDWLRVLLTTNPVTLGQKAANLLRPAPAAAQSASQVSGLDPRLLGNLFSTESGGNPGITGPAIPGRTERAQGLGQMLPSTYQDVARRYGLDPEKIFDANSNAIASALYLRELIDRYEGDLRKAVLAYGGHVSVLNGGGTDQQKAAAERYLSRVTGAGLFGQGGQPAVVGPPTVRPRGTVQMPAPAPNVAATPAAGPPQPTGGLVRDNPASRLGLTPEDDEKSKQALDSNLSSERRNAEAAIRGFEDLQTRIAQRMREVAQTAGTTSPIYRELAERYDGISERLGVLRANLDRSASPFEQFVDRSDRLRKSFQALDPVTAQITQRIEELDEAQRKQTGSGLSPAQRLEAEKRLLEELSAQYRFTLIDLKAQTEAQTRIADAYLRGEEAAKRQMAAEQALQIVRQAGLRGPAATAAQADVQTYIEQQQRDAGRIQVGQRLAQMGRTREQLDVERQFIAVPDSQEVALARTNVQSQQLLRQAQIPLDSDTAKQYMEQAKNLTLQQRELAKTADAYRSFQSTVENSLTSVTTSLTDALLTGKWTSFRDTLKGVASSIISEFMKLSVINPIMNGLFGGNRGTLFDLGSGSNAAGSGASLLGKLFGGGGSGSGALGAAGAAGASGAAGAAGAASGGGMFSGMSSMFSGMWDSLKSVFSGLASSIGSLVSSIGSGIGSMASGLGSIIGSIFHEGGVAGHGGSTRALAASIWREAPRYHTGGIAGLQPGEIPAILKRGELVLNERQQSQMMSRASAQGGAQSTSNVVHMTINTPDAGSFRHSQQQIRQQMARALGTASRRV